MKHFIHRAGQDYGPYTLEDLQRFVAAGYFQASDQARTENMTNWVTVAALLQESSTTAIATLPIAQPARVETTAVMASPLAIVPPTTTVPLPVSRPEPKKSIFSPLTWPFHEHRWIASMWISALWWLIVPTFGISLLVNLGWFVDAIGRRGRKDPQLLPPSRDLLVMAWDGLVFLMMWTLYFTIPLLIIGALFEWTWATFMSDSVRFAADWVYYWVASLFSAQTQPQSLADFFLAQEQRYTLSWLVPIVYGVAATPMFIVALSRFAVTRKITSFFKVFTNLFLLFRHGVAFGVLVMLSLIWYGIFYGSAFLINQLIFLQPLLALVTIILWFPVLMWAGAYLTGNYAKHLCESGVVGKEVQPSR